MIKNLILLCLMLGFTISVSGCSSSDEEKKASDEYVEESDLNLDEDVFAEDDQIIADLGESGLSDEEMLPEEMPAGEGFTDAAPIQQEQKSDFLEEDAEWAEESDNTFAVEDEAWAEGDDAFAQTPSDEFAETEPLEPLAESPETNTYAEPGETTYAEPVEEPLYEDSSAPMNLAAESEEPQRTWVPVKKIADTPYEKNGVLVNAVYIVRPGDDLSKISQKIYGSDRTQDLIAVNTWAGSRAVKVGDKIYYNSPRRPQDRSQVLTYYEDLGLAPEIYISKPDENIRVISSELLGSDRSWMEVWATNPDVESKGVLPEGTQLRYWPGGEVPAPAVAEADSSIDSMEVAANEPPPAPEDSDMEEPPMEDLNDVPPEPETAGSTNQIAEPTQELASQTPPPPAVEPPPPPPPPPPPAPPEPPPAQAAAPPPPPPPPPPPARANTRDKAKASAAAGTDDMMKKLEDPDNLMTLGAAAILFLAAAAMIVINRKKKARQAAIDFNTQTQIE